MKENLFEKDCIRTFTGIHMNAFEPTPEMIDIVDIAHGLSNQCRFAGHTKEFYSVAQHSIHVAELAPDNWKLQALLHDASEAYLCDIPRPIKKRLPDYLKIEENLMRVIGEKFGFDWPMHKSVKNSDQTMLIREWDYFVIGNLSDNWQPMNSIEAKAKFLEWFYLITKTTKSEKQILKNYSGGFKIGSKMFRDSSMNGECLS
jgi:hypothetical protein